LASGDAQADFVIRHRLGAVVPPGDVEALVHSLRTLLATPNSRAAFRDRFESVVPLLTWHRAAAPLCAFACDPWLASDHPRRAHDLARSQSVSPGLPGGATPTPIWELPLKAWDALRQGGPKQLASETRAYLRWLRG
jgi:hypothetical protein